MTKDSGKSVRDDRKTTTPVIIDPGMDESAAQSECCSASMARYKASEDDDK